MPDATDRQALPYPVGSDAPLGPQQIQDLAEAVETRLVQVYANYAEANAADVLSPPSPGMMRIILSPGGGAGMSVEVYGSSRAALEPPMVSLTASSVALTASVYTAIPWQTVLSRNAGGVAMWDAGQPTRIVAAEPGTYAVSGWLNWPGALGANDARVHLRTGGADVIKGATQRGSTGNISSSVSGAWVASSAGAYIEVMADTPGITLNEARISMWRISTSTS